MPRKWVRWHIEKSCKRYSCSLINTNYLKAHLIMFKTISLAASALLLVSTAAQAIPVSGQGTWETTLQARDLDGDGVTDAFYDTELNVTWLRAARDTNSTPAQAATWASSLVVSGYGGWRLPFVVDTGAPGCDLSFSGGTDVLAKGCDMTYGSSGGGWLLRYHPYSSSTAHNFVTGVVSGPYPGGFGTTYVGPRFSSANFVPLCSFYGC